MVSVIFLESFGQHPSRWGPNRICWCDCSSREITIRFNIREARRLSGQHHMIDWRGQLLANTVFRGAYSSSNANFSCEQSINWSESVHPAWCFKSHLNDVRKRLSFWYWCHCDQNLELCPGTNLWCRGMSDIITLHHVHCQVCQVSHGYRVLVIGVFRVPVCSCYYPERWGLMGMYAHFLPL